MKVYIMERDPQLGPFDEEWVQTEGLPFNVASFEEMIGKEFFLGIRRKSTSGTGSLAEIVLRTPGNIKMYVLGALEYAKYNDGKDMADALDPAIPFRDYIFRLKDVEFPRSSPPVLRGTAQEYNPIANQLSGAERNVELLLKDIPTLKLKSDTRFSR